MRAAGALLGSLSAGTAAVGLAWVVIVLIAFAVAGLIRQVNELRAVVLQGFGRGFLTEVADSSLSPRPGFHDSVVLVMEPASARQDLLDAFGATVGAPGAHTEARLLTPVALPGVHVPPNVTSIVDSDVVEMLSVPWYPALVHLGAHGEVLDAAPVGSLNVLPKVLARFDQQRAAT